MSLNFSKKVSVVGLGYVGLPLLHLLSKKKIDCNGFDLDENKINFLKKNKSYVSDLKDEEVKIINKKNIFSLTDIKKIRFSDYIIICLPTPVTKKKIPDMRIVKSAFEIMEPYLKKNQSIILESTVYPGATCEIFEKKLKQKFNLGKNFFLCYSPERINPGQSEKKNYKYKLYNTTKVISGYDKNSLKKIENLYSRIFQNIYKAKNIEIAEMSKLVENSYRSVNIGLVNELKMICDNLNLDFHAVQAAAATKPFGYNHFRPGPGVGGHCIPIDPLFVDWVAKRNSTKANFINLARLTNLKVTKWTIDKILKIRPDIKNIKKIGKILIIGLAYKADVNDTRESPSIKIFKKFEKLNNIVHYHDPLIKTVEFSGKQYFSKKLNNLKKYDFVIICTDHTKLNKKLILKNAKLIFDTRRLFKGKKFNKVIQL